MKPYYDDGSCVIYHGDCRDLIVSASFQVQTSLAIGDWVVITDPPYGIGWKRSANPRKWSKPHDGIVNDEDVTVRDGALTLLKHIPGVVFGSFYAPPPPGLKQVLVWPKPAASGVVGATTGFRRDVEPVFLVGPWPVRPVLYGSLLPSGAANIASVSQGIGHPHTKPVDLLRHLIEASPPGTVFDPFMGSGTTLRAAKDLGRKAIGIEIEERYCEIAAQRLGQEVLDLGAAA